MNEAPRADLVRMVSLDTSELRADADNNELVGYGAVFNSPTLINSWEGRFEETIAPGAFRKTIEERGDRVKVQFDHGMDSRYGSAPIAVPVELREDAKGLFVRAEFVNTEAGRDIRELIRSGAVDGMSFRFSVIRDSWDNTADTPVRTVQEVRLDEVGPVTWPAYEATTVGVRSAEAFALLRSHFGAADSGTPAEGSPTLAPTPRKQIEQQRRRLAAAFPKEKK